MTLLLAAGLVLSASCAPVTPGGGFSARVSLEDGPSAALICEETGFADSFPFDQAGVDALLYDENGKLASEYTEVSDDENGIDPLCYVSLVTIQGRDCVQIVQYLYGDVPQRAYRLFGVRFHL